MFWLSFKGLKMYFEKQKFRKRFGKCFQVVKKSLFMQTGIREASFESQIYSVPV